MVKVERESASIQREPGSAADAPLGVDDLNVQEGMGNVSNVYRQESAQILSILLRQVWYSTRSPSLELQIMRERLYGSARQLCETSRGAQSRILFVGFLLDRLAECHCMRLHSKVSSLAHHATSALHDIRLWRRS